MHALSRYIIVALLTGCVSGQMMARTRIARRQKAADTSATVRDTALARMAALSVSELDSILSPLPQPAPRTVAPAATAGAVGIMGEPEVDVERMTAFVRSRNAAFPREIAEAFYNVGRRYGVRGDIALCQSILETGWFRFEGGTAVRPEQHNYCGLGVTRLGLKGCAFDTVEQGVTAQIQHLYAYACRRPLPEGETLLDPRFNLVERGVASTWQGLNRRWAANDHYSERILKLFSQMRDFNSK